MRRSRLRLAFQFREERQRLDGRHAIDIDRGQPRPEPVVWRGRLEEPELALGLGRRAGDRRSAAAHQLVALERAENLASPLDNRAWKAGQPRDLDSLAAVRAAGHDLPEKDDVVLPLAGRDVVV